MAKLLRAHAPTVRKWAHGRMVAWVKRENIDCSRTEGLMDFVVSGGTQ